MALEGNSVSQMLPASITKQPLRCPSDLSATARVKHETVGESGNQNTKSNRTEDLYRQEQRGHFLYYIQKRELRT
jgi:hypothetical protein